MPTKKPLSFEFAVDGHYCPKVQCTKEMEELLTKIKIIVDDDSRKTSENKQ